MNLLCYLCFTFVLPVPCSLVITCWERVLVCDVPLCFCHSLTLSYGVSGQVWYLIVSIADLCLLYFYDIIRLSSQSRWDWTE